MPVGATYSIGANSVIQVTIVTSYQGSKCLNVLHYSKGPLGSNISDGPTFLQALTDSAVGAGGLNPLVSALSNCQVVSAKIDSVQAQVISPQRWAKVQTVVLRDGQISGDGMPSDLDAVITKMTVGPGRSGLNPGIGGRGAFHVAGLPRVGVAGAILTPAYRNGNLGDLGLELKNTLTLGTDVFLPILFHRNAVFPNDRTDVNGYFVQPEARVMRRRQLGLGI